MPARQLAAVTAEAEGCYPEWVQALKKIGGALVMYITIPCQKSTYWDAFTAKVPLQKSVHAPTAPIDAAVVTATPPLHRTVCDNCANHRCCCVAATCYILYIQCLGESMVSATPLFMQRLAGHFLSTAVCLRLRLCRRVAGTFPQALYLAKGNLSF